MSQAAIRPARLDDVSAIRALVEGTYRGDQARQGWTHEADLLTGARTSDAEIAATIVSPAHAILVAKRDGVLVGTVTVSAAGPARAYLGMLSVAPEQQGSGLGRRLIIAAEAEARRHFGALVMEMTVIERRHELIAWYERRGYQLTGETRPFPASPEEPVDFAMVVMERSLS